MTINYLQIGNAMTTDITLRDKGFAGFELKKQIPVMKVQNSK